MATLALIVWGFAFVMFVSGLSYWADTFISAGFILPKTIFGSWVILHLIVALPFGVALFWDIYHKTPIFKAGEGITPERIQFALILGFTFLVSTATSSLIMRFKARSILQTHRVEAQTNKMPKRLLIEIVVFMIGVANFVASLLGILDFYLGRLR